MNKQEELLAQVLEECLEEDLSFIPPEGEIARKHRFSAEFEQAMNGLLEEMSRTSERKEIRKHFSPRYGQMAACILVFCVCGWLFCQVSGLIGGGDKSADTSEAPALESAYDEAAESGAAGNSMEALPEESEVQDDAGVEDASAEEPVGGGEGREYCGRTVYPSAEQELPERLEQVTALVNCPVLDEDNPVLMLTIGNTGEEDIRYLDRYELEVWLENAWYRIPAESGREGEWRTLEAGMAVDAQMDLSEYRIDYDASQYRLVIHAEQEALGVEFTFGEVFRKTMEDAQESAVFRTRETAAGGYGILEGG